MKAGVAKALWFEPTLNATFAAMAEHYHTTVPPTRSRKPRDKAKVEGVVLNVERWIVAIGYASPSSLSACWTDGRPPIRRAYSPSFGHRDISILRKLHQPSTVKR